MKVNLMEEEQRRNINVNWNEILISIFVITLFISVLGHFYFLYVEKITLENQVQNLNEQISRYQPYQQQYNKLQKKINDLEASNRIGWKRYMIANSLNELIYTIPQKLTLKSVNIKDGYIRIPGFAANNKNILDFVDNLEKSPYFEQVSLKRIKSNGEINFQLQASLVAKGE